MTLPHERYIRYLIMCNRSQDQVNTILNDLSLAPIYCGKAWDVLYRSVFETRVTKEIKNYWRGESDKEPKDYKNFMRDMGMEDAYASTKAFKNALRIAEDAQVSKALQMLIMKRVDPAEITAIVGSKYKIDIDTNTLEMFEKYLFRVSDMTKQDWRYYYTIAPENVQAFLIDVFRLDLDTLKVQYGFPAKISYTSSLQELHVQAMCRVRELMRDRHPESDKEARAWASLAIAAGDRYEKFSPKDMANFSKEVQMGFQYVETRFPSISELTSSTPSAQINAPAPKMEDADE